MYTTPFEIVHTNILGLAPYPSSLGFSYYTTCVDAYTKYTWIYFFYQNSKALYAFKLFLSFVKT